MKPVASPVVLYDGVCGLCNWSVQTIITNDARGLFRFAALQNEFARSVIARHPELAGVDSVVLVETDPETGEERVSMRSTAALRIAELLGGGWSLLVPFRLVPPVLRDYVYDLTAHYRYALFGRYDTCLIPSPEVRARFLDFGEKPTADPAASSPTTNH